MAERKLLAMLPQELFPEEGFPVGLGDGHGADLVVQILPLYQHLRVVGGVAQEEALLSGGLLEEHLFRPAHALLQIGPAHGGGDLHNQIRPVAITQTDGETLFGELKE